jgi:hypothetical protein
MRLTLIQLSMFVAKWRRLDLSDDDLRALEDVLLTNPAAGKVIAGTGGLRKLRFAPPTWHSGKRGGSRVIYAYIDVGTAVYLFTVYGKSEQSDLSATEKKVFRQILERLKASYDT